MSLLDQMLRHFRLRLVATMMKKTAFRPALITLVFVTSLAIPCGLLWPKPPWHPPLTLSFVKSENAGMFDDRGVESQFVTVRISNSQSGISMYGSEVYFRNDYSPMDAKVANQWVPLLGTVRAFNSSLRPGQNSEQMILVPGGARACRVCLQCARARVVRGKLAWLADKLPRSITVRFPSRVWRWVGYPVYGPGSDWQTLGLEVNLKE
jgi:hypothetical protein